MKKKHLKIFFCCQSCGYQSPKWLGKCPDCGNWHTLIEEKTNTNKNNSIHNALSISQNPMSIKDVEITEADRVLTNIKEFDRVLGGGIVAGSLVLIGGDPGIGKSTLMLQVFQNISQDNKKVLYISGEESLLQIKLRSQRINTNCENILVASDIDVESIISTIEKIKPSIAIIDSIQTMINYDLSSIPGSVTQIRESTMKLMLLAKKTGIPIFLVGHVTKDGTIAGPKVLEHMVDTVLYFEGDTNNFFRILRAVKNRFGSTNEIGVFEMKEKGLCEVENPSALLLSERPKNAAGSVVTASMEGTRPLLVELQALVNSSNFATPQRTILGLDYKRVALLVAVIEKNLSVRLMGHDIFMNVAGGMKIIEPSVDLGIVSAICSSYFEKPILNDTVCIGEVGLTGEIRAINQIDVRISEITKMGFKRCLLPENNLKQMSKVKGIEIIGIKKISDAMEVLFN